MKKEVIKYIVPVLGTLLIAFFIGVTVLYAQDSLAGVKGEISTIAPGGATLNLPGAKLTITSNAGEQSPQPIFADESGSYEFKGLKPGAYSIQVVLDGFKTFTKTITLAPNQTLREDIKLDLDGVNANVQVQGDNNGAVNVDDSSVSGDITKKNLQNTPLANEQYEDALPLIPGVVRGSDGLISVKGAQPSQNGTLVGDSNGDDPVTGNSAINLPLEALESVQVISNPFSAQFGNFNGGVVQLQTRSGTDKWDFGITNFFPRFRKRDGSIRGVESATPRINFGGPLKKGKLFLFQTFEYRFIQTEVEVDRLPALERDIKLESFDSFTRVDYNVSDTHRINFALALYPQKIDFINLNTFNPQGTSANLHQRGFMFSANDQYVTARGEIWQTTFSLKGADADVFGNSPDTFTLAPEVNTGGFFNSQDRDSNRYEAQTVYSRPAFQWGGQHQLKFGVGFSYTTFDGINLNQPVGIARADGTLNQLQTYFGDGVLDRNKSEIGFFVQDKWTLSPRITIDYGIRFDRDNLSESLNPAPRIGFAFSPFRNNRTVIRGGAGVFFSKVPINVGVFDRNQDVLIQRFAADGVTETGSTFFRNTIENNNIETPYSIGWTIQMDRELSDRFLVRLGYEQRETRREFILSPITGSDPTQGVYQLGKGGSSSYREFLLMTRVRIQNGRDLFFSYTQSRSAGDLNIFGTFAGNIQNPIVRENQYSRLAFDAPRRFLFWGEFGLPFGLTLSPVVDWRNGFPYSVIDENQDFIGRRNSGRRFPNFFSADIQLMKDVKIPFRGKKHKAKVGVKFFNLTNHFNPRDVQNNIDSNVFGGFFNSVDRKFRMKFNLDF